MAIWNASTAQFRRNRWPSTQHSPECSKANASNAKSLNCAGLHRQSPKESTGRAGWRLTCRGRTPALRPPQSGALRSRGSPSRGAPRRPDPRCRVPASPAAASAVEAVHQRGHDLTAALALAYRHPRHGLCLKLARLAVRPTAPRPLLWCRSSHILAGSD